jgi:hypothetical protein
LGGFARCGCSGARSDARLEGRRAEWVQLGPFGTVASPSFKNSNRLVGWMREMGALRQAIGCAA